MAELYARPRYWTGVRERRAARRRDNDPYHRNICGMSQYAAIGTTRRYEPAVPRVCSGRRAIVLRSSQL